MTKEKNKTRQIKWSEFRFAIIGPLLASPPKKGELKQALEILSKKLWNHPTTGEIVTFSFVTLQRWYYQAKKSNQPVNSLIYKKRSDADTFPAITKSLSEIIFDQYKAHPSWSYQLHHDNVQVVIKKDKIIDSMPSYNTIRRYMKFHGLTKQRNPKKYKTIAAELAAERFENREVRSYEVEYVNALWHLDFHHGSIKILDSAGEWRKPLLLCILDDHSRLVCHAQWYFDETAETLVHGVMQALQKRGLPRALMSDNGPAMISAEFTEGLSRLSIVHEPTLPYSPYQNGKQEVLWGQVEGRLLAMLEGESELTLKLLNDATIAWVEFEYQRKVHKEISCTPLERYLNSKNVTRDSLGTQELRECFCIQVKRKQRKSDGTISIEGKRFEIPSRYRHIENLSVRYPRWDLGFVFLVDGNNNTLLERIYPQDKAQNANAQRRLKEPLKQAPKIDSPQQSGIAPLLKELMEEYAQTGFPPAYIPKGDK